MGGWVRLIFQDEEHDNIIHKNVAPREDKDETVRRCFRKRKVPNHILTIDTKCLSIDCCAYMQIIT